MSRTAKEPGDRTRESKEDKKKYEMMSKLQGVRYRSQKRNNPESEYEHDDDYLGKKTRWLLQNKDLSSKFSSFAKREYGSVLKFIVDRSVEDIKKIKTYLSPNDPLKLGLPKKLLDEAQRIIQEEEKKSQKKQSDSAIVQEKLFRLDSVGEKMNDIVQEIKTLNDELKSTTDADHRKELEANLDNATQTYKALAKARKDLDTEMKPNYGRLLGVFGAARADRANFVETEVVSEFMASDTYIEYYEKNKDNVRGVPKPTELKFASWAKSNKIKLNNCGFKIGTSKAYDEKVGSLIASIFIWKKGGSAEDSEAAGDAKENLRLFNNKFKRNTPLKNMSLEAVYKMLKAGKIPSPV